MKKVLLSLFVFCAMAFPSLSHAAAFYFGGMVVYEMVCTCSPYTYFWFSPLYLNSGNMSSGALSYPDTGTLFANYYLTEGGWGLGHYTTGVQACYLDDDPCFTLSTSGTINQNTGSSL